jgi:hypothetical protein
MELNSYLEQTADQVDSLITGISDRRAMTWAGQAHTCCSRGQEASPALLLLCADAVNKGSAIDVVLPPSPLNLPQFHSHP